MVNLSNLIGLPVLNKSNATLEGYVSDVFFDAKCKKTAYFQVSKSPEEESFKLLDCRMALAVNDAVIINAKTQLIDKREVDTTVLKDKMLSKQIFSYDGIKKGYVVDVEIGERHYVKTIITDYGNLDSKQILNNNQIIFVKAQKRLKSVKKFDFSSNENSKVSILNDLNKAEQQSYAENENLNVSYQNDNLHIEQNTQSENVSESIFEKVKIVAVKQLKAIQTDAIQTNDKTWQPKIEQSPVNVKFQQEQSKAEKNNELTNDESLSNDSFDDSFENADNLPLKDNHPLMTALKGQKHNSVFDAKLNKVKSEHNPYRIICDYDFLLGRELQQDLSTYMGEIIAPKGSLVTDGLVEQARLCGKLVELTLNSK